MNNVLGILVSLSIITLMVAIFASLWGIFKKANHPGWAILIPLYNSYVLLNVAGMSGFWLLALLVPYGILPVYALALFRLAGAFRKGFLFGLGLVMLPFIFLPLLAFREEEKWYGAVA
ncbi:DUF5684 domain-containing protein [Polyangium sp. 6x1]|uniref:DUF5684 domain-containing protein n=1 Tax=Polyangium sp. 6x1 TaxID=3042689 RepID=UPI002482E586|nr:DUF5684 domain-containing protein [Polyangium sp. 6x1]MDI1442457.1 DUF5684 domain-containing protein [Polyangium sp. 6x1]